MSQCLSVPALLESSLTLRCLREQLGIHRVDCVGGHYRTCPKLLLCRLLSPLLKTVVAPLCYAKTIFSTDGLEALDSRPPIQV